MDRRRRRAARARGGDVRCLGVVDVDTPSRRPPPRGGGPPLGRSAGRRTPPRAAARGPAPPRRRPSRSGGCASPRRRISDAGISGSPATRAALRSARSASEPPKQIRPRGRGWPATSDGGTATSSVVLVREDP